MRCRILFPFRFKNLNDVFDNPGNNPNEFLYGIAELKRNGKYVIDYFLEEKGRRDSLLRYCLWLIEQPFVRSTKLGIPFGIYLHNRNKFKNSDVVFCINDAISFSVLFFKSLGLINCKVITLFQSLTERRYRYFHHNHFLIFVIRQLLKKSDHIVVLSDAAMKSMSDDFGVPLSEISTFNFGADLSFWEYKAFNISQRPYILAIGNDMNRDYSTLLKAVGDKYELIIVTGKDFAGKENAGDNVTIKTNLSNDEVRKMYQGARVVVTPSVDVQTESSGLSTAVQSMACGTPVIISDSPPMRELFTDRENILFYKPLSTESLRKCIDDVWNEEDFLRTISRNGCVIIQNKLNSVQMASQLEVIIDSEV